MICKTHGGTCPTPLRCSSEAAEQAAIERRVKARYMFRRHCPECGRNFDLNDEIDREEWEYGHDCEV